MSATVRVGLLALIVLCGLAAVYVSVLISRRQDLPAAARRAFLLSNLALILCLASAVAGISLLTSARYWGLGLIVLSVLFLVVKFVFVRKFAHLIRQSQRSKSSVPVARVADRRT